MKKFLLFVVLTALVMPSFGQEPVSRWLVGGSSDLAAFLAFDHYRDDNGLSSLQVRSSGFSLTPKAGYFVFNETVVGIDFPFSYNSTVNENTASSSSQTQITLNFQVAPFIRKYIGEKKIRPFIEAEGGFGYSLNRLFDVTGARSTNSYTLSAFSILGGVSASLSKSVAADLSLGYSTTTQEQINNNPTMQRTIHGTFGLNLGITVVLETPKTPKTTN